MAVSRARGHPASRLMEGRVTYKLEPPLGATVHCQLTWALGLCGHGLEWLSGQVMLPLSSGPPRAPPSAGAPEAECSNSGGCHAARAAGSGPPGSVGLGKGQLAAAVAALAPLMASPGALLWHLLGSPQHTGEAEVLSPLCAGGELVATGVSKSLLPSPTRPVRGWALP